MEKAENVEVVYAKNETDIWHTTHAFEPGMTVSDALDASGILAQYSELETHKLGIFSKPATKETRLMPGDRVEIYRPLLSCPKEKRRKRAK
jgi:putative ubiquitin-RnfH superfamily antitoxin RatB of RatAB toxin-antitoxin module